MQVLLLPQAQSLSTTTWPEGKEEEDGPLQEQGPIDLSVPHADPYLGCCSIFCIQHSAGILCSAGRVWLGPAGSPLSSLPAGVKLDPTKAWCPVLECQAVCSLPPSTEGQPGAVPCATCRAVFCSACRGAWLDGHACSEQQPMMSPSDGWVPIHRWLSAEFKRADGRGSRVQCEQHCWISSLTFLSRTVPSLSQPD